LGDDLTYELSALEPPWQQSYRSPHDSSLAGAPMAAVLQEPPWQQSCRIPHGSSLTGAPMTAVLQEPP